MGVSGCERSRVQSGAASKRVTGSRDFKKALLKDHAIAEQTRAWDAHGQREVQQIRWAEALEKARSLLHRSDCTDSRKSAPWRVALAAYLKKTTDVKNEWLAEQLQMGAVSTSANTSACLEKAQRRLLKHCS